jgi:hypothetical protein
MTKSAVATGAGQKDWIRLLFFKEGFMCASARHIRTFGFTNGAETGGV